MKIYQIHAFGGEWEDSFDYIVASYLSEIKANQHKKCLEEQQTELRKCYNCPLYDYDECDFDEDDKEATEKLINKTKEYCSRYKAVDSNKHNLDEYDEFDEDKCANYEWYWDFTDYRIEEVEVIE